ncbi:MAG TPA: c-type cytochrome [Acidimicrobiales bacterium]|jgi:ubiquinol-cytochrome c reductase cytochrome c subunit
MRNRLLLPAALVAFVVALGLLSFGGRPTPARAQPSTAPTTPGSGASTASTTPAAAPSTTSPTVPVPSALSTVGQPLFVDNCSSCHGLNAEGTDRGPNLVGVGAATVDFWVSTGRMPLAYPGAQAVRKPVLFSRTQQLGIVSYVTSLGAGGVGIPALNQQAADQANGNDVFGLNCAGCHVITGVGDALANSAFAPSLYQASPTQIAEAIRTGPGNMPRFGPGTLSDQEVNDVVRYVTYLQHPANPGGAGLGHVGPVTEGFIAIVVGLGVLILAAYWIGIRAGATTPPGSDDGHTLDDDHIDPAGDEGDRLEGAGEPRR